MSQIYGKIKPNLQKGIEKFLIKFKNFNSDYICAWIRKIQNFLRTLLITQLYHLPNLRYVDMIGRYEGACSKED